MPAPSLVLSGTLTLLTVEKKGQITTNPDDMDDVVRRAWKKVYDGTTNNIGEAVNNYLHKYAKYILKAEAFTVEDLTGQRVQEFFSQIGDSAAAMDGWNPKELSLLSPKMYEAIATMLTQIEQGAPWPHSVVQAKVAYLQKDGAVEGEVMSYRPLTISAALYRAWAALRLEDMQHWISHWRLDEMYAGVPGKGAVDAWHEALSQIEDLKLDEVPYCGAVADIAKFFDQIRREVVVALAGAAGMPSQVLDAYGRFLEDMTVYNCLPGGMGKPHKRKCGLPQGCPFSMAMVALLMRPWIVMMRGIQGVRCYILADDVMILAEGSRMLANVAQGLNETHEYLKDLGARVAPGKSYNFASNKKAASWLRKTTWKFIGTTIDVVTDFRYLGAHVTTRNVPTSATLDARWEKGLHSIKATQVLPNNSDRQNQHHLSESVRGRLLWGGSCQSHAAESRQAIS